MKRDKYTPKDNAWADKKRNIINTFEDFYKMDNYTQIDYYTLDLIRESAKAWYNYYHIPKEERLYDESNFDYQGSERIANWIEMFFNLRKLRNKND